MAEATRRTALAVLGLAATPITTEAMSKVSVPGYLFSGDTEAIARALRSLADDFDSGGSLPTKLVLTSAMEKESFLEHELKISFVVRQE